MAFCENCGYSFNITNDVSGKQIGGHTNVRMTRLLNKIQSGAAVTARDIRKITARDVNNNDRFDKLNKNEKKQVVKAIKDVDRNFFDKKNQTADVGLKEAYFVCRKCSNKRLLQPGTVIYTINANANAATDIDPNEFDYVRHDATLARTRVYLCPNPKCTTHQDMTTREAALTKKQNNLVYVCCVCNYYWINNA